MKGIFLTAAALVCSAVFADISADSKIEIEYLTNFVEMSSCKINRNGKNYDGKEAATHIQKKYDYFKDEINTAEQFIEYSATKSTISGNYYLVSCGNSRPLTTRKWLLNELNMFRLKKHR